MPLLVVNTSECSVSPKCEGDGKLDDDEVGGEYKWSGGQRDALYLAAFHGTKQRRRVRTSPQVYVWDYLGRQ